MAVASTLAFTAAHIESIIAGAEAMRLPGSGEMSDMDWMSFEVAFYHPDYPCVLFKK